MGRRRVQGVGMMSDQFGDTCSSSQCIGRCSRSPRRCRWWRQTKLAGGNKLPLDRRLARQPKVMIAKCTRCECAREKYCHSLSLTSEREGEAKMSPLWSPQARSAREMKSCRHFLHSCGIEYNWRARQTLLMVPQLASSLKCITHAHKKAKQRTKD